MGTKSSSKNVEAPGVFDPRWKWKEGALTGVAASLVMGAVIAVTNTDQLGMMSGLYGAPESVGASAVLHLFHGAVFGALFAAIHSDPAFHRATDRPAKGALAGMAFGVLLGIVGAGLILPMWVQSIGIGASMSVPHFTPIILGWHVVYGTVLGLLFSGITGEKQLV
jgi:hypothetical protein